jgi:hypothetical protein
VDEFKFATFFVLQIASFPLVAQNESAVAAIEVAHAVTRCFRRNKMVKRRELVPLPLRPRIPYNIPLIIGGWMDKIGACDLVDGYDHLSYKWAQVCMLYYLYSGVCAILGYFQYKINGP